MSREIKFRAWNNDPLLEEPEMCSWERIDEMDTRGEMHLVDILTGKEKYVVLMQYTGLNDKNEKEIYEGDICSRNGHSYEIHFTDGAFGIKRTDDVMAHIHSMYHGHALYNYISELEVIGNIYENRDLL